jgi:DNA-binding NarL/FixJ family response regulator
MITLRGRFVDGKIEIIDDIPFSGDRDVLITFLSDEVSETSLSREVREELVGSIRSGSLLTPRELDVLNKAQEGLETTEIADALGLAHGTVRNYFSSTYRKLEVRNRIEALKRAVELGLLDPITMKTT